MLITSFNCLNKQEEVNKSSTVAMPKQGHSVRVAIEGGYVFLDPRKDSQKVEQGLIPVGVWVTRAQET